MSSKGIFGKNLKATITSDDILGKEVIDASGKFIGLIETVFFDKKNLDFIGIAVDKGIFSKGLTIGKGYIERLAEEAVFLKVSVLYELKGMTVFDVDGGKIGRITKVNLMGSSNSMKSLEVRHSLTKKIKVPGEYVSSIGENVLLNIKRKDLMKIIEKMTPEQLELL